MVGPSFSGKTYLLLKILSRRPVPENYVSTKSPPEQYSISKIQIKELGDEINHLNEYESAILVFADVLSSSIRKNIGQLSIRGRHNKLDI